MRIVIREAALNTSRLVKILSECHPFGLKQMKKGAEEINAVIPISKVIMSVLQ